MENFFSEILFLSVVGTVSFMAISFLLKRIESKVASNWHFYLRLVSLLPFLLPFRLFSGFLPTTASFNQKEFYFPIDKILQNTNAGHFTAHIGTNLWSTVSGLGNHIWLGGTLLFLVIYVGRYKMFCKQIAACATPCTDRQILDIYRNIVQETRYTRNCPSIFVCSQCTSPMLVGLFRPAIILPATSKSHEEMYFMLKHEFTHFTQKDLPVKFIINLIHALHWFNPLYIFVKRELYFWSELSCDNRTTANLSDFDKKKYGNLLLSAVATEQNAISNYSAPLSNSAKKLKLRLSNLVLNTTMSIKSKTLVLTSVSLLFIFVIGGSLSVYALNMKSTTPTDTSPISTLLWPVNSERISLKYDADTHSGIDIISFSGATVCSSADGRVLTIGLEQDGLGNYIIIGHTDGMTSTLYGHLGSINVSEGDFVWAGDTIGEVGRSGSTTGAVLHFQINVNETPVNPLGYKY